ncbi:NYN domain-containing protein [Rhodococcus koreensis]
MTSPTPSSDITGRPAVKAAPSPSSMPARRSVCTTNMVRTRSRRTTQCGSGTPAQVAVLFDWAFVVRSAPAQLGADAAFAELDPMRLATEIVNRRNRSSEVSRVDVFDGVHDQVRRPDEYAETMARATRWQSNPRTEVHLHRLQYLPDGGFRQKEIDVELALTMVERAHSGQFDTVIAFTGDRDFRPAARRVVEAGVRFESACWGHENGLWLPEVGNWCHELDLAAFRRCSTPRRHGSRV